MVERGADGKMDTDEVERFVKPHSPLSPYLEANQTDRREMLRHSFGRTVLPDHLRLLLRLTTPLQWHRRRPIL